MNDEVAELGCRVDIGVPTWCVSMVFRWHKPDLVYFLLNKPEGVVTTASDPQGRPTVLSLVPECPGLHAVGRLDMATEGLLLLTNDGNLTHAVTHPSKGVEKEYLVQVAVPLHQTLEHLRRSET